MNNKKSPSILETNLIYLAIALLLITLGSKAQYREIYTGLLITEYLIVLLPILLYLKLKDYSIGHNLKLNKISFKQAILILFIVIFSYPIAVFFNFIGIMILSKFIYIKPNSVPIPSTWEQFLIGFLVIGLTPGICEEIMFRGMVMSSYESLGRKKAIIYSAVLFGLFHFNAQNLFGPIYLGILFGIIAYKTNSLISTILGHTVNNTIALTIGYVIDNIGNKEPTVELMPEMTVILSSLLVLGVVALLLGFIVYKLIKLLPDSNKNEIIEINSFFSGEFLIEDVNMKKGLSIKESIPIFLVVFIFVIINYKYLFI